MLTKLKILNIFRKIHDGPLFTICPLRNEGYLTGGGKDHQIIQLDNDLKLNGHKVIINNALGGVRAIVEGKNEQIFVGTTRNCILNGQFPSELATIVHGHCDELWGLGIHPESNQFVTGAFDHILKLWNAETHNLIWSQDLVDSIQSCTFSISGNEIVVGMTNGKWIILDVETRTKIFEKTDGHEPIQTVRFSPNGHLLAVGSRDNHIYVYQVLENNRLFERIGKCSVSKLQKIIPSNLLIIYFSFQ